MCSTLRSNRNQDLKGLVDPVALQRHNLKCCEQVSLWLDNSSLVSSIIILIKAGLRSRQNMNSSLYFCVILYVSIFKSSSIYVTNLTDIAHLVRIANRSSGLNDDLVNNSEHVLVTGYLKFLDRTNSATPFGTKYVNSVATMKGNVTTAYPVLTTLSQPPTVPR